MHARSRGHVLAHIVDANIHELDGVERAAPEMGRRRGMGCAAMEGELDLGAGKRERPVDARERRRVPGDREVHIIKGPGTNHKALRRAALFSRTTKIAHATFEAVRREIVLDGSRC